MDNYMLEDELAEAVMRKQEIAEKWEESDLLETETDPWKRLDLALVLENQRLYNSQVDSQSYIDSHWRRMSIPIVTRIWRGLIAHQIASVQPLFGPTGYFYDLECENKDVQMRKTEISVANHRLKAVWALEAAQDLRSVNNIDAEAELTFIIAQEACIEINRKCINIMQQSAANIMLWDFFGAGSGETIREKYESLYSKIIQMKIRRGTANWIVTSPEIAAIFETSRTSDRQNNYFTSSLGVNYIGEFGRDVKFKLFKDPLFPMGRILTGYKGNHPYDAGFFLCPHVLLKQTPTVLDPNIFIPRKGLETDWASFVDSNFFGLIKVANLLI